MCISSHLKKLKSGDGFKLEANTLFLPQGADFITFAEFKRATSQEPAEEWCLVKQGTSTDKSDMYPKKYNLLLASTVTELLLQGGNNPFTRLPFASDDLLRGTAVLKALGFQGKKSS